MSRIDITIHIHFINYIIKINNLVWLARIGKHVSLFTYAYPFKHTSSIHFHDSFLRLCRYSLSKFCSCCPLLLLFTLSSFGLSFHHLLSLHVLISISNKFFFCYICLFFFLVCPFLGRFIFSFSVSISYSAILSMQMFSSFFGVLVLVPLNLCAMVFNVFLESVRIATCLSLFRLLPLFNSSWTAVVTVVKMVVLLWMLIPLSFYSLPPFLIISIPLV